MRFFYFFFTVVSLYASDQPPQLVGIVNEGNIYAAALSSQQANAWKHTGEHFSNWEVVSINTESVIMEQEGVQVEVYLGRSVFLPDASIRTTCNDLALSLRVYDAALFVQTITPWVSEGYDLASRDFVTLEDGDVVPNVEYTLCFHCLGKPDKTLVWKGAGLAN